MNDKGFTLVELVVMIAVLAMISIICFISVNDIVEQSRIDNCKSLVNNIKSGAKEFIADNRYKVSGSGASEKFVVKKSDGSNKEFLIHTSIDGRYISMNALDLVDGKYISSPIYNPFEKDSDAVDLDTITFNVYLNDDYTAKKVIIGAPLFLANCEAGI